MQIQSYTVKEPMMQMPFTQSLNMGGGRTLIDDENFAFQQTGADVM